MSVRQQKWMRKGHRVLALLRPGKITRTRSFVINGHRFVYLFEVQLDGDDKSNRYHPSDVEELTKEKL